MPSKDEPQNKAFSLIFVEWTYFFFTRVPIYLNGEKVILFLMLLLQEVEKGCVRVLISFFIDK
jgi:hypothetical protein